jgi:signal transduction histidine kinase
MSNDEQHDHDTLRPVLHQLLLVREEERRAAALTLHDEIAQSLTLISLHLSIIRKQQASDPGAAAEGFAEVQRIITAAQDQVRGLEFGLYPKVVEFSITEALKGLVHRLTKDHGYSIEYVSPPAIKCGRKTAIGLYRVVENLFTGQALRQSVAWRVKLMALAGGIEVSVVQASAPDDGVSLGLDLLAQEHLRAYGGQYATASYPTRIKVMFPLE